MLENLKFNSESFIHFIIVAWQTRLLKSKLQLILFKMRFSCMPSSHILVKSYLSTFATAYYFYMIYFSMFLLISSRRIA